MATKQVVFFVLLSLLILLDSSNAYDGDDLQPCLIDAFYQFGDSSSDTGNLIRQNPNSDPCARFPYGKNFPKKGASNGRCNNGLLLIDLFAMSARYPLVDAYSNSNGRFRRGINFAVSGSTALSVEDLAAKGITNPVTNTSLSTQLDWLSTHLKRRVCRTPTDCSKKLKQALFIVGDIGGTDYYYALFQGKTINDVKSTLVPQIVQTVKNAVTRVIGHGAARIVVPGIFPIGCFPIYLTKFQTNNSAAYDDDYHCLQDLNNLATYHNDFLKRAIEELKKENPKVAIVYGDYFGEFIDTLYQSQDPFGPFDFDPKSLLKACCGVGGDYNFDLSRMCGSPGVKVCPHPGKRISWDGIHLTQEAYRAMTIELVINFFEGFKCGTDS